MARMTSSYWIVVFTTVLAIFFSTTSATVVRLRHVDQETRKIQKSVNAGKTKSGNDIPSCDNFDASKVKLVTFDVFAALMDLTTSLTKSISTILPYLTTKQVNTFVNDWESGYSSYAGVVFDETVTGPSPFQWVIRTSLDQILKDMQLTVTTEEYEALVAAWGQLTPWAGTEGVLAQLYNANFTIAALSNGDHNTLISATSVFKSTSPFSNWFSSDFPVGSFKPDEAMYNQVLKTIAPENHLHVAGASTDGWGSRKAGMYSALLRSKKYPLPPYPCFLLDDITDLPAVLGL